MIFDSSEMSVLRERYRGQPDYSVPDIVCIDRHEEYVGERIRLEELISQVNPQKQKDWFGRLISVDHPNHKGAWFEIMLYGWLLEHFDVTVEPEIQGNFPDFVVSTPEQSIAIEAKAFLRTPEEQKKREIKGDIATALESIQKPYLVDISFRQSGVYLETKVFFDAVNRWLSTNANEPMKYSDQFGNLIKLSATPHPNCNHVLPAIIDGYYINSDVLKKPLREKASQHRDLQKANYPYVLAFLIESSKYSAEEAVEAWFGRNSIIIDTESHQVIDEKCDQTGVAYWKRKVRHKNVSGILVFKQSEDMDAKSRYLRAWYIQNPFAKNIINPSKFPAEARYVVAKQNKKDFEMKWSG